VSRGDQPGERAERLRRARDYPFERPASSYVLHAGVALPIESLDRQRPGATEVRRPGSGEPLRLCDLVTGEELRAERVPVLAAGSNASPEHLARKLECLPEHLVLVAKATLRDFACVYSAHFTSYGSIPATLDRWSGAESDLFVTWFSPQQLEVVHASEALGTNYHFACLDALDCRLEDGHRLESAWAYLSLHGRLAPEGAPIAVREVPSRDVPLRKLAQPEVLALAHAELRDLLEGKPELDDFLDAVSRDAGLRATCIRALRERLGQPLAVAGWAEGEPEPPAPTAARVVAS
jgi:hypothetical protein